MQLVKRSLKWQLVFASVCAFNASAENEVKKFLAPEITQQSQHVSEAKRIRSTLSREHYSMPRFNNELSEKTFLRFIDSLDYNKSIFLQQDIDSFEQYRLKFDDALVTGDLKFAFEIFEESVKRRIERYEFAIKQLDNKLDFTNDDKIFFDREEAPWAKTQAELDEYWRLRVKYDALNLKLAGKEEAKIKETLVKRYTNAMRRLSQQQSEDAFQIVMNSYTRSIEAHTSYLSPRNADRFQINMNLELEGIGAVLKPVDEYTVVSELVPGGPAEQTEKIKPEDKIIAVAQGDDDYVEIIGWRLDDVIELIKGKKGTEVRLQVVRGEGGPSTAREVAIIRDKIRLEDRAADSQVFESSVSDLNAKIGVITIPSFYHNLSEDIKVELAKLKDQNVEGIVVDLRGNGGGSLTESYLLTGLFIDRGAVVQARNGVGQVRVYGDNDGVSYYDGPLTVLVDRYSASASEIFSAALQDHGRALIVGEQTFGKGTVQQHTPLARNFDNPKKKVGAIQFTTAKFYRVNGGSTQHKGVIPDIKFPSAIDPAEWGESKEENALPWDNILPVRYAHSDSIKNSLTSLTTQHQTRIAAEPEFGYLFSDIEEYKKNKEKKFVSLNENVRRAEKEQIKAKNLQRLNKRLQRFGFDPVESLDTDIPKKVENLDPFLEETARITADLVVNGKVVKTIN